ncbi:MAG: UDP-N-acetylmuramoyl-L-alanine--D-glutamate ligase [Planctomycetes bacterium]|nr:UDP-N-acetylmuramoyl-L-alanine--D-glutamate ligase [Planctomycetota bacterium]
MSALAFAGRRVTVMGLGLQGGGVEVVRFLAARGAQVTVTDKRPAEQLRESLDAIAGLGVRTVLGLHRAEDFTSAEVVVANPAVAPHHPLLVAARAAGVLVTSEMALFLAACPARVVLVTGTQGKSSTTHATARLLEESGFRVHLGGNIGRALISALDDLRPDDLALVEISSYQLEALPEGFGPCERVAAVACVNVLADHLERHGTVADYDAAKRRILDLAPANATVVLSADDPRVGRWQVTRGHVQRFSTAPRARTPLHIADGEFRLGSETLGRVADLRLAGEFQRGNMLAALGLARALGAASASLARAVGAVRGLEHRLQDLGEFDGHRVWDNGISTTPDSTMSALQSLERPLVLLCGGQAKQGLPLDELAALARERARAVVTFGGSSEPLAAAFRAAGVPVCATATLREGVARAWGELRQGETLLFSPACASFDEFLNFRDRALRFREHVQAACTAPTR